MTGAEARMTRTAWWFLAPFGVLFVAFAVAPILFAAGQSLFTLQRDGLGLAPPELVFDPLANYVRVFGDERFLIALGRVLLFGVVQVPVMLGAALGIALLIDSRSARAKGAFRLVTFLPYAVPSVVAAILWSFLYSPVSSPINGALQGVGWSIDFFSPTLTLWSIANVVTWAWTGYNMIIIYSALQTIPGELLEAARLDGASAWQVAWRVKIPMIRPALIMTLIFSIIGSAQLFNEPRVLQAISGGSIDAAYTPLLSAQTAAAAQQYPFAAAQSVVLAVLVGGLSFLVMRLANRSGA